MFFAVYSFILYLQWHTVHRYRYSLIIPECDGIFNVSSHVQQPWGIFCAPMDWLEQIWCLNNFSHTLGPRYIMLTYIEFLHTSRIFFAFKYH